MLEGRRGKKAEGRMEGGGDPRARRPPVGRLSRFSKGVSLYCGLCVFSSIHETPRMALPTAHPSPAAP